MIQRNRIQLLVTGAWLICGAPALLLARTPPNCSAGPVFASAVAADLAKNLFSVLPGQFSDEDLTGRRPDDVDPMAWHVSDPHDAIPFLHRVIDSATRNTDREFARTLLDRFKAIERPTKVRLSLQDAIHRALAYSHAIRVESYRPAISTTTLVEAEAAFDAVYFMNLSNNELDIPTAPHS